MLLPRLRMRTWREMADVAPASATALGAAVKEGRYCDRISFRKEKTGPTLCVEAVRYR